MIKADRCRNTLRLPTEGEQEHGKSEIKFYFREPTIDTNIPITDGTVKIEGFDWEFVPNEAAADAWDCGFAARVRAYAQAAPHISIPAFPNRKFRLAYIFVNSKAGIETAKICKDDGSASCTGTTRRGCGRAARCSMITAWT